MTLLTGRCSVEMAACRALRRYLQAEFDADPAWVGKPVVVDERWPEPDSDLPERAVTIITAGEREDSWLSSIDNAVRVTPVSGSSTDVDVTWRVAACEQPIQLDVWATSSVERDSLLADLDRYLHKGEKYTLGIPTGRPVRDGVLLALSADDGHQGFADFTFEGHRSLDQGEGLREREYRAIIRGTAAVDLCVVTREKRMLRVLLELAMNGVAA